MSADYYFPSMADAHENVDVTYNLSPMLWEAGFPGHREITGAPASEAGGVFRKVAETLRSDPDRFRKFNPENGWGDYDGAIEFCERMAACCAKWPDVFLETWL